MAAYRAMTDRWHTLGCACWSDVLDLGCGLGAFACDAASTRGCQVRGKDVSGEQVRHARTLPAGLPGDFVERDYCDVAGCACEGGDDHLVSCGRFEHVGYKTFWADFVAAERVLRAGGLFLLHTRGSNRSQHRDDPCFDRYTFPNGLLPSMRQIGGALEVSS